MIFAIRDHWAIAVAIAAAVGLSAWLYAARLMRPGQPGQPRGAKLP
jgi:hypothetical protein